MKHLCIKIFIAGVFLSTVSCTDDLTSRNVNPKAYPAGSVAAATFFSNASRELSDAVVYGMVFKILSQQFAEATYINTSTYDLTNPGNAFWNSMYMDVLNDLKEARLLVAENPSEFYPGVDQNKMALIEILEIYAFSLLIHTFGDIPYAHPANEGLVAEALDPDNTTPAYEDAAAVYGDLLTRLDAAIAMLDPMTDSDGELGFGEGDLIYNDDITGWLKLATSLKLRMAMTLADVDPSKAAAVVASVNENNLIEANSENATFAYLTVTPNTNPIWVGLIQSGRQDYVASNTMVDLMQAPAVDDPRIPLYYTTDADGGYTGGIYGSGNSYTEYSNPGAVVTATDFPGVLMDYAEVEFFLAEAAARGYDVTGSAAEHYTAGIMASIEYWGGTEAEALAYLADPDVAFATAPGDTDVDKVARQKYIALFNRGFEAWVDYRRFDFPFFNMPAEPEGPFPLRYTYPNAEQTANGVNYTAAAGAIGGDEMDTKLFWDVE